MKITFKNSCLVKPAEPTFEGPFPLSVWDQIGCVMHVPTIYFYEPKYQSPADTIFKSLQSSLSKVLVHFYPLAGRLRCLRGGRLELNCNSAGVELVEAESDAILADLGDFSPSPEFNRLFPCIDYKDTSLEDLPLLYVQLTKFRCGGISLSLSVSHAVVDGLSALYFVSEWARIARGEDALLGRDSVVRRPFLDRKVFQAARGDYYDKNDNYDEHDRYNFTQPPILIGESSNESERKKKTSTAMLKLTKNQVETLKKQANACAYAYAACMEVPCYTRYEVITAQMWRAACKARKLVNEQATILGICVDIRKRIEPALPEGYFGNAIIDVTASGFSGEIISQPLSYAASKIRAAVTQVTDEYVRSAMEFMENQEDISRFQDLYAMKNGEGPFYGNPNLVVVSWITLPLYDQDFGWGKEIWMSPGTHESDGDCLIIPAGGQHDDGALAVAVCLQDCHIEEFRKFFYADIVSTD